MEPDGWAEFCGQPAEAPASSPSNPTSTGYTLNLRTPDRNLKRFTLNNWPGQTVVGAQAANIYGMDFDIDRVDALCPERQHQPVGHAQHHHRRLYVDRGLPGARCRHLDRLEHRSDDERLLRLDRGQPVHHSTRPPARRR